MDDAELFSLKKKIHSSFGKTAYFDLTCLLLLCLNELKYVWKFCKLNISLYYIEMNATVA